MNDFDRYSHSEPTYDEYVYLDDVRARREEARIQAQDMAWEYERHNVVEAPEFRKPVTRGQLQLDFNQEVA